MDNFLNWRIHFLLVFDLHEKIWVCNCQCFYQLAGGGKTLLWFSWTLINVQLFNSLDFISRPQQCQKVKAEKCYFSKFFSKSNSSFVWLSLLGLHKACNAIRFWWSFNRNNWSAGEYSSVGLATGRSEFQSPGVLWESVMEKSSPETCQGKLVHRHLGCMPHCGIDLCTCRKWFLKPSP